MRLFINALSASAGGGLTYIRNVLPRLAGIVDLQLIVAAAPKLRREFQHLAGVTFVEINASPARRFWFEQFQLPGIVREFQGDVLLSAGNFAVRRSPVPQILLSRNSIYLSEDFQRDLLFRREYRMWLDTRVRGVLASRSVRWADVTVAPSESFAAQLRAWTRTPKIIAIHHGFDPEVFACGRESLSDVIEQKLRAAEGAVRLLFVSHYNYYRNFETLFRALPVIRDRLKDRKVRLFLTCKLAKGENPGGYRTDIAAKLIQELGIREMVVELGAIEYNQLHRLYGQADIYISPAYTETFAHPLVEAMYSGLPLIVSDMPVHREVCGDAALYFARFSPEELAERVVHLASSAESARALSARATLRPQLFSWHSHVERLLSVAKSLVPATSASSPREA
jgi:glycosyltransferase involved in cell wall biosynthesis